MLSCSTSSSGLEAPKRTVFLIWRFLPCLVMPSVQSKTVRGDLVLDSDHPGRQQSTPVPRRKAAQSVVATAVPWLSPTLAHCISSPHPQGLNKDSRRGLSLVQREYSITQSLSLFSPIFYLYCFFPEACVNKRMICSRIYKNYSP